jgi:hypothetical protein
MLVLVPVLRSTAMVLLLLLGRKSQKEKSEVTVTEQVIASYRC